VVPPQREQIDCCHAIQRVRFVVPMCICGQKQETTSNKKKLETRSKREKEEPQIHRINKNKTIAMKNLTSKHK